MTDLLPDDDSFVRTAIRGLRVPPHGPDFWDRLAWQLDDAAEGTASQGAMEDVLRAAMLPELAEPEPRPHHVEDPWPEPGAVRAAPVEPAIDLFAPVEEPVYDDEYEEDRADDAAAYDPTYDEPAARPPLVAAPAPDRTQVWVPAARAPEPAPRVRHDRAVVPESLRRPSTAVLLVLALLGLALAVIAGLKLLHQRSSSAAPTSSQASAVVVDPGSTVGSPVVLGPLG